MKIFSSTPLKRTTGGYLRTLLCNDQIVAMLQVPQPVHSLRDDLPKLWTSFAGVHILPFAIGKQVGILNVLNSNLGKIDTSE